MAVWREQQPIKFFHHAIYVGDEIVVEFNNDSRVRVISFGTFKQNNKVYRVPHADCFPPDTVVNRAFEYRHTGFGTYDVLDNNCEHFAYFIKTGRKQSNQADIFNVLGVDVFRFATKPVVHVLLFHTITFGTLMNYCLPASAALVAQMF